MSGTILVTGGAGYVGSHACKALAAAGYRPVVLDSLIAGHRWAVRWGDLLEGDLGDAAFLRRVFRERDFDAVMHFAAVASVAESVAHPERYYANNVANSLTLLEAMRDAGPRRIVFSSSCAVYGVPERVPITEDTPLNPINPYGESKRVVEGMLQAWGAAHGFEWMALRYFNAAGADPEGTIGEVHEPETHLLPLAIAAAFDPSAELSVHGTDFPTPDGTALRDYIHVDDLASAHVLALENLARGGPGGALNLGTGRGHSVREVVDSVRRVTGRDIEPRSGPRRPGDPPMLVADARKAAEILGWRARWTELDAIVDSAVRWHRTRNER
jgi:UDP-arabinose 4-epimerase